MILTLNNGKVYETDSFGYFFENGDQNGRYFLAIPAQGNAEELLDNIERDFCAENMSECTISAGSDVAYVSFTKLTCAIYRPQKDAEHIIVTLE